MVSKEIAERGGCRDGCWQAAFSIFFVTTIIQTHFILVSPCTRLYFLGCPYTPECRLLVSFYWVSDVICWVIVVWLGTYASRGIETISIIRLQLKFAGPWSSICVCVVPMKTWGIVHVQSASHTFLQAYSRKRPKYVWYVFDDCDGFVEYTFQPIGSAFSML